MYMSSNGYHAAPPTINGAYPPSQPQPTGNPNGMPSYPNVPYSTGQPSLPSNPSLYPNQPHLSGPSTMPGPSPLPAQQPYPSSRIDPDMVPNVVCIEWTAREDTSDR